MLASAANHNLTWEKLSPAEFQQLQDFAAYSNKSMGDVLPEFKDGGRLRTYNPDGEIDFAGFKIFMDIFLEVATPEDLCKHLFLSFVRVPQTANIDGKILKEMADITSKAAMAPVTPKATSGKHGGNSEASEGTQFSSLGGFSSLPSSIHHGLSEKLHGFTEKLTQLGQRSVENADSTGIHNSNTRQDITVQKSNEFLGDRSSSKPGRPTQAW